jgi:cysteinyl-tRNA synthetase
MQSHYRKNLVFTWENLENAKIAYNKLVAKVAALKPEGEIDEAAFAEGKKRFTDALDNDLNTSLAVTALYDVFKLRTNDKTKLALIESFETVLDLGLIAAAKRVNDEKAKAAAAEYADVDPELLAYIQERIEARKAAKKAKNFAEADAIRDELLAKGITILDTREGTKFTIN